jgi:hypothetical protein
MSGAANGALLAVFFMVVSCLAYSSTLKLETKMKDTMSRALLVVFILVLYMANFSTLKVEATNFSETYIDL